MEINNIEQFSNDLRKTTTKVINPINNNESKQRNEETNENSLKSVSYTHLTLPTKLEV